MENSHPAIVEPDEWALVQMEFTRRKDMGDTIWTVMERVLVHRNGGLTFQFYNGSEIRIKR